ncbi:hypothetical protein PCANC_10653 [Puccinia coronata f. sp. avenae]|uniref:Pali-domain-containing protein n=1 Tax=Puccinia coronata f. sp. avenae TaxID=200324 RepID=A0A2N5T181_9BASI|nr:hypothetical protein PCASD_24888 [Puccinia coronata f. sp. avenae]PLW19217.1 hypothetical protein PCANC_09990 [Puccinia coronata f. sp. avenae]PLW39458.1 hypothetical protein PCASD_08011 [Puccinia coronata f. sp. avenae]PLW44774.1 hypothetical protein PCANC_10653 [Puccinia coronata f. sp. avenae]
MQTVVVFFGTLSFLFLLTSTILMIASNCTVPTSDEIYFLRTTLSAALTREVINLLPPTVAVFERITVRMGLLGYCINDTCSEYQLGYRVPALLVGGPVGLELLGTGATTSLVINPLFTAFSSTCLVAFLFSIFMKKPAIVFMLMIINSIIGLICLIIDFSIFVRAYWLIRNSQPGLLGLVGVEYGSALWLMLSAFILTFFATLFFACSLHRGDESRSHFGKKASGRHNGP